jgi:hypothetical protein
MENYAWTFESLHPGAALSKGFWGRKGVQPGGRPVANRFVERKTPRAWLFALAAAIV